MDYTHKRTPHAHALNLILLEIALMTAERSTPPQAPRPLPDPDELLAAQLIENIKHPHSVLLPTMRIESPRPFQNGEVLDMAGSDV